VRITKASLGKYVLMLDAFWEDAKARVGIDILLETLALLGVNPDDDGVGGC
jgi:hypothetical protein